MKNLTHLAVLMFSFMALADFDAAGHLTPYQESHVKVELSAEQKTKRDKGELVFWESKSEDLPGKRYLREGSAVFRVHAKPEAVWAVIGDFSKYPEWAYKVGGTKDYKPAHDDKHYIEFKAEIIGKKYYVEHDFPMIKKGYGTWHTDHAQKNECVLDTVGFWKVDPVKGHPDQSDVYYSGKVVLNRTCAKGFIGIGGFDGKEMAKQTYEKIKERSSATPKH